MPFGICDTVDTFPSSTFSCLYHLMSDVASLVLQECQEADDWANVNGSTSSKGLVSSHRTTATRMYSCTRYVHLSYGHITIHYDRLSHEHH